MKFTANTITGLDWAAGAHSHGSYVHFEPATLNYKLNYFISALALCSVPLLIPDNVRYAGALSEHGPRLVRRVLTFSDGRMTVSVRDTANYWNVLITVGCNPPTRLINYEKRTHISTLFLKLSSCYFW